MSAIPAPAVPPSAVMTQATPASAAPWSYRNPNLTEEEQRLARSNRIPLTYSEAHRLMHGWRHPVLFLARRKVLVPVSCVFRDAYDDIHYRPNHATPPKVPTGYALYTLPPAAFPRRATVMDSLYNYGTCVATYWSSGLTFLRQLRWSRPAGSYAYHPQGFMDEVVAHAFRLAANNGSQLSCRNADGSTTPPVNTRENVADFFRYGAIITDDFKLRAMPSNRATTDIVKEGSSPANITVVIANNFDLTHKVMVTVYIEHNTTIPRDFDLVPVDPTTLAYNVAVPPPAEVVPAEDDNDHAYPPLTDDDFIEDHAIAPREEQAVGLTF